MRPLTLHASALTDSEYTLYTTSLSDLAGEDDEARAHSHNDSYYASLKISVRETRAWIRGRYTDLLPANVDGVLKLFCPNLGVTDTLSGGQFFAALRLITHLRHGKPLDGSLVFVQAHPDDAIPKTTNPPTDSTTNDSRRSSREVVDVDVLPLDALSLRLQSLPRPSPVQLPPSLPPKPAVTTPGASSTNPFLNRAKSHDPTPALQPPPLRTRQTQPSIPPLPPRKPVVPPLPPPRHSSLVSPSTSAFPASATSPAFAFWQNHPSLTPGGTSNSNVLIQQSLQAGRIAQSLKKAEEKLEKERVLEVLKSSSGSTSKRTRSESPSKEMGQAPMNLTSATKPRSTSSSAGSASSNSTGLPRGHPSAMTMSRGPALPPRRRYSPPLSSAGSMKSFEQIANASIPLSARHRSAVSFTREPSKEDSPQRSDSLPPPPPTHPDRKPLPAAPSSSAIDTATGSDHEASPTSRVFRSKSMHYPNPPLPPPRRRRPESVQYGVATDRASSPTFTERTVKSATTALSSPAAIPNRGNGGTMSRHLSLSVHSSRRDTLGSGRLGDKDGGTGTLKDESPIANIRNTLLGLQPKLDAARYKAEAGLSRRGYVNYGNSSLWREEGEERLVSAEPEADGVGEDSTGGMSMDGSDEGGLGQDTGGAGGSDESSERQNGSSWDERGRGRSASASGSEARKGRMKPWEVERDEMKWPVGEGWKPL